mmetsp:Transcript_46177/g.121036  ORF Transcript_46177/g.121036 Transcript_46177/m.121036 type:complete len:211 (-) Transcript_46177:2469-3101(-)
MDSWAGGASANAQRVLPWHDVRSRGFLAHNQHAQSRGATKQRPGALDVLGWPRQRGDHQACACRLGHRVARGCCSRRPKVQEYIVRRTDEAAHERRCPRLRPAPAARARWSVPRAKDGNHTPHRAHARLVRIHTSRGGAHRYRCRGTDGLPVLEATQGWQWQVSTTVRAARTRKLRRRASHHLLCGQQDVNRRRGLLLDHGRTGRIRGIP